jgi:serine protease Do
MTVNFDRLVKHARLFYNTSLITVAILIGAFLVGGLLGGLAGGFLVIWSQDNNTRASQLEANQTVIAAIAAIATLPPTPTTTPIPSPTTTPVPTPSLPEIAGRTLPSVVTVIIDTDSTGNGGIESRVLGSGVIIDPRGYIVTNQHVVENAVKLKVALSDGREETASLIDSDAQQDLALIKISGTNLPSAGWGDSDNLRLGEWVVSIGSALGNFPNSVTVGVVSGLNRSLDLNKRQFKGLIQTDAAINRGNSGGPLVNMNAEVIGINTFIIRDDGEQNVAEGIGFAIPASTARTTVDGWMSADLIKASLPATPSPTSLFGPSPD